MSVAYEIVLDSFSGPLDLLLHLIQKNEIDIHDIPMATVTEQYLAYLHAMEELSLDIASEFVVMAATLLAIKSRMLLPVPTVAEDDQPVADPREELVQQLLEYQRYKHSASQLKELSLLQSHVFSREAMDVSLFAPTQPPALNPVSIWDLVDSFRKLARRVPRENTVASIKHSGTSVEETMELFLQRLQILQTCSFSQLMQTMASRQELVSGFMALLELLKEGLAVCFQPVLFGEIQIIYNGGDSDANAHDGTH